MIKNNKELLEMSANELTVFLKESVEKLAKIRIQHKIAPLKDNQLMKKYKTMVARIKTIISSKDTGATDE